MRWIARTAATTAAALALALPTGAAALAASPASVSPATATLAAASCHYRVTGDGVAVRRAPDTTAHVIKRKNRGDQVTGPCNDYFNDGRWWTQVYLGSGGTAWMASAFLEYRGYW
ncbi:MAG TPA: SH3 domain-containing protein [Pseudonocardiaceae bacterium]|jgi:uncharacterized protein YgiM (DUF1202 family)|nr:SH3 domain-containing protein [Pseudonocardiaceae bacterium]